MLPVIQIINLDLPANERWSFLKDHTPAMNALFQCYLNDLEGARELFETAFPALEKLIPQAYRDELHFIASLTNYTANDILFANLYYDILKSYFGCTAFAVPIRGSVLHARNLDWHTDDNVLGRHTMVFDFHRNGKTVFRTVGWPGFIGALSGTRPGSFTVTLNAVLSSDPPQIAYPISFFLRDILTGCSSWAAAKLRLEQTPIASDCLLLISGMNRSELAVIERTPTRFATRMEETHITVTNDYRLLENSVTERSILQQTSCRRYDRASMLAEQMKPLSQEDCLRILQDKDIQMSITVQQMVFDNASGSILLRKAGKESS